MTKTLSELQTQLHNRRSVVILSLLSLAAVHIMDLPAKWTETFYIAVMYLGIIAFAVFLVERLIVKVSRRDYFASALLSIVVLLGYIVNRTVGMPGATDDIGNWFEPLGLLSIAIEILAVWQSVAAFVVASQIRRLGMLATAAEGGPGTSATANLHPVANSA